MILNYILCFGGMPFLCLGCFTLAAIWEIFYR